MELEKLERVRHNCSQEPMVWLIHHANGVPVRMCQVCARNMVLADMKDPLGARILSPSESRSVENEKKRYVIK